MEFVDLTDEQGVHDDDGEFETLPPEVLQQEMEHQNADETLEINQIGTPIGSHMSALQLTHTHRTHAHTRARSTHTHIQTQSLRKWRVSLTL